MKTENIDKIEYIYDKVNGSALLADGKTIVVRLGDKSFGYPGHESGFGRKRLKRMGLHKQAHIRKTLMGLMRDY